jgi:ribose transport system permease protein
MTDTAMERTFINRAFDLRATFSAPVLIVILLALGFGLAQPNFATAGNFTNIAIQASYLTVFALAQTYTVIVRGFDLSLGTTVSLVSVASGMAMMKVLAMSGSAPLAVAAGIATGLCLGLVVGAVNGVAVAWLKLNPFVVTLATLNICLGFASTISGGFQLFNLPDGLNAAFYQARPLGVPAPILAALILLSVSFVVFRYTRFGRGLFLIGSNPRAATIAGLPVRTYLLLAYLACSALAACGALLLTARTGSGEPNLGGNLMLESIAAAVVGGASLRGGCGGVASPVIGALLITVLSNGMNLTRIDGYIQQIVLGIVILATVFGDSRNTNAG